MLKNYFYLTTLTMAFALFTFSCKKGDDEPTPTEPEYSVQLSEDPTLGKILTDANGKTLYYFSLDHNGESVFCVDNCIDAWPIFYQANLTLGAGLDASDFGKVTRADGTQQSTYKGWPLYYFANDAAAGETKGEGVNDVWFVAKPDYSIMLVKAQLIGKDPNGVETKLTSDYEEGEGQTFYFTDGEGNTLYRFYADTKNQNNYTESDFSNNALWPIYGPELGAIPSIINQSDFQTIDVFGRPQITYKGWPLYTFEQDQKRGDNFGVGFPQPGIWPIANQNTTPAQ